jgi:hypothetical protein
MAGKKLAYTVYLQDEHGETVAFGPDSDSIPKWAADKIGKHAYEGAEESEPDESSAPAKRSASK